MADFTPLVLGIYEICQNYFLLHKRFLADFQNTLKIQTNFKITLIFKTNNIFLLDFLKII